MGLKGRLDGNLHDDPLLLARVRALVGVRERTELVVKRDAGLRDDLFRLRTFPDARIPTPRRVEECVDGALYGARLHAG